MGGHVHKSCPQCGRAATAGWVRREQSKLIAAPYFMVTFTLPSELRDLFFGKDAKAAFDAFFQAGAATLSQTLAEKKWLGAVGNGFTMVLHTWNQKMLFHPHLHCIVPGAGLDERGNYVSVKKAGYLLPASALKKVLRHHFGQQIKALGITCDPSVWRKKWGVNVQPFCSGENAIKYLGRYIFRSVIGDSRILAISDTHVIFRYTDRKKPRQRTLNLSGEEFVRRHLRHVQPARLRAVRYYGYHHPAAKKTRQRVQQGSAATASIITAASAPTEPSTNNEEPSTAKREHLCPCCQQPMELVARIRPAWTRSALWQPVRGRAPPTPQNPAP